MIVKNATRDIAHFVQELKERKFEEKEREIGDLL